MNRDQSPALEATRTDDGDAARFIHHCLFSCWGGAVGQLAASQIGLYDMDKKMETLDILRIFTDITKSHASFKHSFKATICNVS